MNLIRDKDGNLLCKRCGNIVPEEFKFVVNHPETPKDIWGPWCSEECMCCTRICSVCNKDFSEDHGTIKPVCINSNTKWVCNDCLDYILPLLRKE